MSAQRNDRARTGTRTVYTVEWLPGSDLLLGICFCGARQEADDPAGLWSWLLGHPQGHAPADARIRRGAAR